MYTEEIQTTNWPLINGIITALDHVNHANEDYAHSTISHTHTPLFLYFVVVLGCFQFHFAFTFFPLSAVVCYANSQWA